MVYDAVSSADSGIFAVGWQTLDNAGSNVYQVKTFHNGQLQEIRRMVIQ